MAAVWIVGISWMKDDLTAQERAALVTWRLARGDRLTTQHIMELTGLSREGVWHLMMRLARVLPVSCGDDALWSRVEKE